MLVISNCMQLYATWYSVYSLFFTVAEKARARGEIVERCRCCVYEVRNKQQRAVTYCHRANAGVRGAWLDSDSTIDTWPTHSSHLPAQGTIVRAAAWSFPAHAVIDISTRAVTFSSALFSTPRYSTLDLQLQKC